MTTKFTPAQLRQMAEYCAEDAKAYRHHGMDTQAESEDDLSNALRQAAEDTKDAERWREFIRCGWPVCFLGETYENAADLNAAVDTAREETK